MIENQNEHNKPCLRQRIRKSYGHTLKFIHTTFSPMILCRLSLSIHSKKNENKNIIYLAHAMDDRIRVQLIGHNTFRTLTAEQ